MTVIAGCALVALVVPLFALQALALAGSVASANGFGRFVPGFWDEDGDGSREIVVGCPEDGCASCDYHAFGPIHVATVNDFDALCQPY